MLMLLLGFIRNSEYCLMNGYGVYYTWQPHNNAHSKAKFCSCGVST